MQPAAASVDRTRSGAINAESEQKKRTGIATLNTQHHAPRQRVQRCRPAAKKSHVRKN
jgi:hypothetical protein